MHDFTHKEYKSSKSYLYGKKCKRGKVFVKQEDLNTEGFIISSYALHR